VLGLVGPDITRRNGNHAAEMWDGTRQVPTLPPPPHAVEVHNRLLA
jgi:hypothetical protein